MKLLGCLPLFTLVVCCELVLPCSGAGFLNPWQLRFPLPTDEFLASIAYGSGRFVTVGGVGTLVMSVDGQNWVKSTLGLTNDLAAVSYGDTCWFVAVGEANGGADWSPIIATSSDGVSWNVHTINDFRESLTGIAKANGL